MPNPAVDDEFSDAECEQGGQVFVVIDAATLADGIAGVAGWSGEIERYWITFCDCLAAGLALRVAVGEWFYLYVCERLSRLRIRAGNMKSG
jgi:hypothetical protein